MKTFVTERRSSDVAIRDTATIEAEELSGRQASLGSRHDVRVNTAVAIPKS